LPDYYPLDQKKGQLKRSPESQKIHGITGGIKVNNQRKRAFLPAEKRSPGKRIKREKFSSPPAWRGGMRAAPFCGMPVWSVFFKFSCQKSTNKDK
jgi:hypothetical protein